MSRYQTAYPRSVTQTRKPARYECRVMREVVPNQQGLVEPLGLLATHTANFVNYRQASRLGMTVVMLEGVMRGLFTADRRGIIPKEEVQKFEHGLRTELGHAQYADYDVPVQFEPLALYGLHRDKLGLSLCRDYRPIGDRAMIEEYIRDNYEQANGDPVSKRYLERNAVKIRPHVTIGEVRYENMTAQQADAFRDNPGYFLAQAAYRSMDHQAEEFGVEPDNQAIIWPEEISFGGLIVRCQQKQ